MTIKYPLKKQHTRPAVWLQNAGYNKARATEETLNEGIEECTTYIHDLVIYRGTLYKSLEGFPLVFAEELSHVKEYISEAYECLHKLHKARENACKRCESTIGGEAQGSYGDSLI